MPRADDPARGFIVTANNRIAADGPGTGDYLGTDTHPPYRARRIEELLTALGPGVPGGHGRHSPRRPERPGPAVPGGAGRRHAAGQQAAAIRDLLLAWDARMAPGSVAAACYTRLRWALAAIVGERSGLAAASAITPLQLPGRTSAVSQLWWVLPALLRAGDVTLTGGRTWPELLADALAESRQNRPRHGSSSTGPR